MHTLASAHEAVCGAEGRIDVTLRGCHGVPWMVSRLA